ncbi:MAG: hypothetical protein IJS09_07855, partial [Treponema sp.]|nr:hypothetical protein [Treponema sp.]
PPTSNKKAASLPLFYLTEAFASVSLFSARPVRSQFFGGIEPRGVSAEQCEKKVTRMALYG